MSQTGCKPTEALELSAIAIRPMVPADLDAACEVIGRAFADNPNTLAVLRGDRARAQRVMRIAVRVAKLGRPYSHVLIAEVDNRVVGALNAAPWPNCQLRAIEKLKAAPAMIRVLRSALPRQLKLSARWEKHDPRQRHWHIGPIGVDVDSQGQGVGRALISSFLAMADEQRSPAYLETDVDRNVALYETFGFTVTGQENIIGINNRFMWRETRAADGIGAPR